MSEAKSAIPFAASYPDSEVPAKAQRRKFSAEDKQRILEEIDHAAAHGGIGARSVVSVPAVLSLDGGRKTLDARRAFRDGVTGADGNAGRLIIRKPMLRRLAHVLSIKITDRGSSGVPWFWHPADRARLKCGELTRRSHLLKERIA